MFLVFFFLPSSCTFFPRLLYSFKKKKKIIIILNSLPPVKSGEPINRAKSFKLLPVQASSSPLNDISQRRHVCYGIINRPRLDQQVTRKGGRWNGIPTIGTANGENFKLLRKREFFATLKFTSTCDGIEAFGAENFHGRGRRKRGGGERNDT